MEDFWTVIAVFFGASVLMKLGILRKPRSTRSTIRKFTRFKF